MGLWPCCINLVSQALAYPISFVIFIVVSASACGVMVIDITLADFCMNPNEFALQLLPQPGIVYNVTRYYVTCEGVSPLENIVEAAHEAVESIEETAAQLTSDYCSGTIVSELEECCSFLSSSFEDATRSADQAIYGARAAALSCEPMHRAWNSLVEDGVCDCLVRGGYAMWPTLMASVALMGTLLALRPCIRRKRKRIERN
uniref:Uncharacterized protein n=2 Tax=Octactis speculum TaxID=3111310 RepID=A0A7S2GKP2_9STRA